MRPTLDRRVLVAYLATYQDLYWVLDTADRGLLLALPASAFDNDRAQWGIVHGQDLLSELIQRTYDEGRDTQEFTH